MMIIIMMALILMDDSGHRDSNGFAEFHDGFPGD